MKKLKNYPLLLIGLLGCFLRVYYVNISAISPYEAHIQLCAKKHFFISYLLSLESRYPFLYFAFVHFLGFISWNIVFLRLPSIIFGMLVVVIVYLLGRKILPESSALIPPLLITFSPINIFFSTSAIPVVVGLFFILLSSYFYIEYYIEGKVAKRPFYIVSALLSLYTLHISLVFVLFHFLFLFYQDDYLREKLITKIKFYEDFKTIAFYYIPGIFTLCLQLINLFSTINVKPFNLFHSIIYIGNSIVGFPLFYNSPFYISVSLFSFAVFFVCLIILTFIYYKEKEFRFFLFSFIFGLVALVITIIYNNQQEDNPFIILTPFIAIFISLFIERYFKKYNLLLVCFLSFLIFSWNLYFYKGSPIRNAWKETVSKINKSVSITDGFIISSNLTSEDKMLIDYYFRKDKYDVFNANIMNNKKKVVLYDSDLITDDSSIVFNKLKEQFLFHDKIWVFERKLGREAQLKVLNIDFKWKKWLKAVSLEKTRFDFHKEVKCSMYQLKPNVVKEGILLDILLNSEKTKALELLSSSSSPAIFSSVFLPLSNREKKAKINELINLCIKNDKVCEGNILIGLFFYFNDIKDFMTENKIIEMILKKFYIEDELNDFLLNSKNLYHSSQLCNFLLNVNDYFLRNNMGMKNEELKRHLFEYCKDPSIVYASLGVSYLKIAKDYAKSTEMFEKAMINNPDSIWKLVDCFYTSDDELVKFNIIKILCLKFNIYQKFDWLFYYLDRTDYSKEKNIDFLYSIHNFMVNSGVSIEQMGTILKKLLKYNPKNSLIYYNMAIYYIKVEENYMAAKNILMIARSLDMNDVNIKKLLIYVNEKIKNEKKITN